MIPLIDKKVLVTGGTRGIGKEIVAQLREEGCQVLSVGRKDGDLATVTGVGEVVVYTNSVLGNPDILINCAGVYLKKTIQNSTLLDYDYMMNINVRAMWLLCKAFSPYMLQQKWGRIVNFGSIASFHGHPDQALYNTSKHAVLGLSRALFKEFNPYNVRVLCVCPGGVQTDMGRECVGDTDIRTFLDPKEVAQHTVFNLKFDAELVNTEIRINRYIETGKIPSI